MLKIFVKWGWANDYDVVPACFTYIKWFDTEEEAEAFKREMKAKNGSHFKVLKEGKGTEEEYNHYLALADKY